MVWLSREQRAMFARNGFLRISGAANDATCEALIRWTNERLPDRWSAEDASTWTGEVKDSCHVSPLSIRRGRMVFRIDELKADAALRSTFGPGSPVEGCAKALIGSPLAPVKVRGLYPIFPAPADAVYPPFIEGHIEAHPSHLVTVTYASDAEAGGGALLVWPGSHRAIYPAMGSKLEHVASRRYRSVFRDWCGRQPIEVPGKRGDVILLHHRLLHAPGVNRRSGVRYGFICDYRRADFLQLCEQPPSADMWEDWPAMRDISPQERERPCDHALARQHAPEPAEMDDTVRLRPDPDPSRSTMKKKGDASVLERMRVPGDRWLILSDAQVSRNDWKLFPRGSDLGRQGVTVRVNGRRVRSLCQYDHFTRLDRADDVTSLTVSGLRSDAWLRIVETRLPIAESRIALCTALPPGDSTVRVDARSGRLLAVELGSTRYRSALDSLRGMLAL